MKTVDMINRVIKINHPAANGHIVIPKSFSGGGAICTQLKDSEGFNYHENAYFRLAAFTGAEDITEQINKL